LNEWIYNATNHVVDIEESYHLDAKNHHEYQDQFRNAGPDEADAAFDDAVAQFDSAL